MFEKSLPVCLYKANNFLINSCESEDACHRPVSQRVGRSISAKESTNDRQHNYEGELGPREEENDFLTQEQIELEQHCVAYDDSDEDTKDATRED